MTNNSTSASVTTSTIQHNSKGHEELVTITETTRTVKRMQIFKVLTNGCRYSLGPYFLVMAGRFII